MPPQGDIDEAARNLSALPALQELGLAENELSGTLENDSELCRLVQVGAGGRGGVREHGCGAGRLG